MSIFNLFFFLAIWRVWAGYLGALSILFLCLSGIFLFYSVNYRTLSICLTAKVLKLKFGIFSSAVPLTNVDKCHLDRLPTLMRLGGAGIHFMRIRGRYRASFNFLEYPRIVIALKSKAGPVWDISFSTRRPGDLLRLIQRATGTNGAVQPGPSC